MVLFIGESLQMRSTQDARTTVMSRLNAGRSRFAGTKRSYGGPTQARKKARTTSGAVIQPSDDESSDSDDDSDVPANSTAGTAAPPLQSGTAGSPLGVVSSTSTSSTDTATTLIMCGAIPSSSAAAAAVIPTDTSNNPDMFHDRFNVGGDATSAFNDIFTGFHHNDLDSLFFNFDFDEVTSNMTL